jgi:hypothetical protein
MEYAADHIATTPHDINRFRIAALSLDDYAAGLAYMAGLAHDAGQSAYDLFKTARSPRPEESDRRRLRVRRAHARRYGRDFAGPAGGRSCVLPCSSAFVVRSDI